ncbi:MAG: phosphoglucosamine mutase [Candidatus Bruticola sp.]
MARLFGTDGIRGRANDTLTPELAFKVGRAHGYLVKEQFQSSSSAETCRRPVIAVGRDTRVSGQLLQNSYVCGLISSGVNALCLDIIPTPGVAWAIRRYNTQGGCVVSASHNPFYDNGLKLIGADGYKLSDEQEDELEDLIGKSDELPRAVEANIGAIISGQEAQREYARYIESLAKLRLDGLKIVLDCANGASSALAEGIFRNLGAEVTVLHRYPNGTNINNQCGSTHPESMQKVVVDLEADFGLCFDGDADRCLACDELGQMIDGDHMLLLFAKWLERSGHLPGKRLVTTVMANLGLEEACRENGFEMTRTAVGDRYVLEEMRRTGSVLGGEQSGHIIFLDYATTGDGLVTGVMLSQIIKDAAQPLSKLAEAVVKKPQYMVNVKVKDKHTWNQHERVLEAVKSVEDALQGKGRLLIRPSGTENLIRVMAEGPSLPELKGLVDSVCQVVSECCSC